MHLNGGEEGVPRDVKKAVELFKTAANDSMAMYELGVLYEQGVEGELPADMALSREWFAKAAQLGHAGAQARAAPASGPNGLDPGTGGIDPPAKTNVNNA